MVATPMLCTFTSSHTDIIFCSVVIWMDTHTHLNSEKHLVTDTFLFYGSRLNIDQCMLSAGHERPNRSLHTGKHECVCVCVCPIWSDPSYVFIL